MTAVTTGRLLNRMSRNYDITWTPDDPNEEVVTMPRHNINMVAFNVATTSAAVSAIEELQKTRWETLVIADEETTAEPGDTEIPLVLRFTNDETALLGRYSITFPT